MKPPPDSFTIFVVCDNASHSKPQAVTNFVLEDDETHRLPGHHWDELYPGKRRSGADSAVTLIGNEQPWRSGLDDPDWSQARAVYELECRKCRKPYQWRLPRFFSALDRIHERHREVMPVGVLPVSLAQIAAIVSSLPETADTGE